MQPRHRLHYSTIPNDRNVSCLQGDVSEQAGSDILPTIPPFHSANNAKVLPCHNAVSTNYSAMPSFRQCHRSTVSSSYSVIIPRYHHSIPSQSRPLNSPKEYRSKEHRYDKETVLTLIPWYHEIIPTIPSYWSRIMPVRNHTGQESCLSGIILVKNHACPESYWSRIILVKNHACPKSFRERYHSDNDLILTRCGESMKTGET